MIFWLDGAIVHGSAHRVDATDRGFLLGDGLFETIRVQGGRPCLLDRHLARLREGAAVLRVNIPCSDAKLREAIDELLIAAELRDAALRITVTRGPAPRGLLPASSSQPMLLIAATPLPPQAAAALLIVATSTRRNERSPLARIKSLNYLDGIIARQEAADRGADDAILLNTQGLVAEATAATLILSHDGHLVTPDLASGALPGVARGLLLESGRVAQTTVTMAMLHDATEIVLVNALGVRAVAVIEGRALVQASAGLQTLVAGMLDL